MSEYQEFTGRTVEEAIRAAQEALGVAGLADLDFEILTPGSRGVLGMASISPSTGPGSDEPGHDGGRVLWRTCELRPVGGTAGARSGGFGAPRSVPVG